MPGLWFWSRPQRSQAPSTSPPTLRHWPPVLASPPSSSASTLALVRLFILSSPSSSSSPHLSFRQLFPVLAHHHPPRSPRRQPRGQDRATLLPFPTLSPLLSSVKGFTAAMARALSPPPSASSANSSTGSILTLNRTLTLPNPSIEDVTSGEIKLKELHTAVPDHRVEQIRKCAATLGHEIVEELPLVDGARATPPPSLPSPPQARWIPTCISSS